MKSILSACLFCLLSFSISAQEPSPEKKDLIQKHTELKNEIQTKKVLHKEEMTKLRAELKTAKASGDKEKIKTKEARAEFKEKRKELKSARVEMRKNRKEMNKK
jgi:hypothetical protein